MFTVSEEWNRQGEQYLHQIEANCLFDVCDSPVALLLPKPDAQSHKNENYDVLKRYFYEFYSLGRVPTGVVPKVEHKYLLSESDKCID